MPRPIARAPAPSRRARWLLPVAVVGAVVVAFVAGRLTGDDPPRSQPGTASGERSPEATGAETSRHLPAPAWPAASAPSPTAEAQPADALPPRRVVITPEIAQRVTTEAKAQMEAQRQQIVSRCWRSTGADKRGGRVSITYNVTFDAQGREIARGIGEDRRAPAGAFADCLRKDHTALSVSPPGTNVGISFAVSYP